MGCELPAGCTSGLSRKSLYITPIAACNREWGDGPANQGDDCERGCADRIGAENQGVNERFRAQILLRLEGLKIEDVAGRMGTSMPTVLAWSSRFERFGLDGLKDKTGRGRKPSIPAAKVERVVTEATRPPEDRNRWSVRSMAGTARSSLALRPVRLLGRLARPLSRGFGPASYLPKPPVSYRS